MRGQELVETVTIVSFVTDDSGGVVCEIMKPKELLDEIGFAGLAGCCKPPPATP